MAEISRRRNIVASPQSVWDVLADFGALASWADGVDHSSILRHGTDGLVGTARRVQVGREVLVETITVADAPNRIGYDITGLPGRLGRIANHWTLRAGGGGTEVTLTSTVGGRGAAGLLVGFVVTRVMARQSTSMLAGLAHRLEGNP